MAFSAQFSILNCFISTPSTNNNSLFDQGFSKLLNNPSALKKIVPVCNHQDISLIDVEAKSITQIIKSFAIEAVEDQSCPFIARLTGTDSEYYLLYSVITERIPIFENQVLDTLYNQFRSIEHSSKIKEIYYSHHLFSLVWALLGWKTLNIIHNDVEPYLFSFDKFEVHSLHDGLLPEINTTENENIRFYYL